MIQGSNGFARHGSRTETWTGHTRCILLLLDPVTLVSRGRPPIDLNSILYRSRVAGFEEVAA